MNPNMLLIGFELGVMKVRGAGKGVIEGVGVGVERKVL